MNAATKVVAKRKPEKNSGFERESGTHDLCDAGAVLYQCALSSQLLDILRVCDIHVPVKDE